MLNNLHNNNGNDELQPFLEKMKNNQLTIEDVLNEDIIYYNLYRITKFSSMISYTRKYYFRAFLPSFSGPEK